MDNSSAQLLNETAGRLNAMRYTVHCITALLVKNGLIHPQELANVLASNADELAAPNPSGNPLVHAANQATEREMQMLIDQLRQAGA